ncbi:uncharacterized protein LOC110461882 [Mizuhopecten yessoensis]|uniref:uncharacterized protein LOC110461882 n=1 Tax=Mizuhopecten yessoensis TaxID=6573 RepID=UPI000B45B16D|nr:uncharacterized protein LOC110461882 [Mizuhopecten yessoensis]
MNLNMYTYGRMSDIYLQKQIIGVSHRELSFYLFIVLLTIQSSTDAVTLTGSSGYAVPGSEFTLTCDVPKEANSVQLYRRPDVTAILGYIQVAVGQCYNTAPTTPVLCSPDVCSCTTTSTNYGTVFQWVIQPQTGDHVSVWYCRRTNPTLPEADKVVNSPDYTLNVAASSYGEFPFSSVVERPNRKSWIAGAISGGITLLSLLHMNT